MNLGRRRMIWIQDSGTLKVEFGRRESTGKGNSFTVTCRRMCCYGSTYKIILLILQHLFSGRQDILIMNKLTRRRAKPCQLTYPRLQLKKVTTIACGSIHIKTPVPQQLSICRGSFIDLQLLSIFCTLLSFKKLVIG